MVRNTLQQISDLLEKHNQGSNRLAIALAEDDAKLWDFLESNELWGGAGSIADEGLIDRNGHRLRTAASVSMLPSWRPSPPPSS
jgi:hypothetical protein